MRHTTRVIAMSVVMAIVAMMAAGSVGAEAVFPPGAPQPQPAPQCPPPPSNYGWFQPNCPYDWTFADPSVIVVPNDPNLGGVTGYYAFGTNTGGSLLPIMWSTDPLSGPWTPRPAHPSNPIGDPYFNDGLTGPYSAGNVPPPWVMTEPGSNEVWQRKQLWAPGAMRLDATHYVVFFAGQKTKDRWCIGRATASNPWGPYTADAQPAICTAPDGSPNGVIDPQPFTAPDGTRHLIYKSEGVPGSQPTSLYSRRLDANGNLSGSTVTRLLSTSANWQMWDPSRGVGLIENPAMVHFGGRYYLFYSGNDWRTDSYGTGYAICSGPSGPCTNQSTGGPFLRSGPGYTGAGGASPFVTPEGFLMLGFAAWSTPGNHAGGTRKFHTIALSAASNGPLSIRRSNPVKDAKYVRAAYLDFLGRTATASEVATWTNHLGSGASARPSFMAMLTTSREWIGATVDRMFVDTLGRPADAAGKAYWVDALASRRVSVAQAAAYFYSSPEYFAGFGHSDNAVWIGDLYTKILGRSADNAGLSYWQSQVAAHGRDWVAAKFYESSESRHTRVARLYQALLGRAPDAGGWDYWADRVGALGDLELAAKLGVSDEYYNRAQGR